MNPRGFFHASVQGSGLYPFTAAFSIAERVEGRSYGLFCYEGRWELQHTERREV